MSSSLVKEVAAFGGDVSGLVPDFVLPTALAEKLAARSAERRVAAFCSAPSRAGYASR